MTDTAWVPKGPAWIYTDEQVKDSEPFKKAIERGPRLRSSQRRSSFNVLAIARDVIDECWNEMTQCHRQVCGKRPAICYNTSTREWYCLPCTRKINDANDHQVFPTCSYCQSLTSLLPFDENSRNEGMNAIQVTEKGQSCICGRCSKVRIYYENYCAATGTEPEDDGMQMFLFAWKASQGACASPVHFKKSDSNG